jgi:hypothetical protein
MRRLRAHSLVAATAALALAGALVLARPTPADAWGEFGHRMVGRLAADALPAEMPAFFREAAPQLAYLNPEPDRWLERAERELDPALNGATAPDHYIDADLIPPARLAGALAAPSRYAFADSLRALGLETPQIGTLPFRVLELTQRLRTDFRRWRREADPATRRWIEQRIIDDAGILGHFVADGSNPAHTTRHHNGWVGDNPRGYTTDRTFHSRFESGFVQARVTPADVRPLVATAPQVHEDVRAGVRDYLARSHAEVARLYDLEKVEAFAPANARPEHRRFAAERLAAGATMLRDLWWTAWVTSGLPVQKAP